MWGELGGALPERRLRGDSAGRRPKWARKVLWFPRFPDKNIGLKVFLEKSRNTVTVVG